MNLVLALICSLFFGVLGSDAPAPADNPSIQSKKNLEDSTLAIQMLAGFVAAYKVLRPSVTVDSQ